MKRRLLDFCVIWALGLMAIACGSPVQSILGGSTDAPSLDIADVTLVPGEVANAPAVLAPSLQTDPTVTPITALIPGVAPIVAAQPARCMESLQQRELKEPYQRNKSTNEARFTLSADELNAYLSTMGIVSLCIPADLGAPFLNADWSSTSMPGTTGQMISLGFENLYEGAGWSQGFVLYSTYDFAAPTEYEIYATVADRDAVQQVTMSDMVGVNGAVGFMRIRQSTLCFGQCGIDKTIVFPFETYYVAVVYHVGYCAGDDNAACESAIRTLKAGDYPSEQQVNIAMMDSLASTIQFPSQ